MALHAAVQAVLIILVLLIFIVITGTTAHLVVRHQTCDIELKPVDLELGSVHSRHPRSRKLGPGEITRHVSHPSLEHGPGPTIYSKAPVFSATPPKIKMQAREASVVPALPFRAKMQAREESGGIRLVRFAPDTLDKSSSLRRAVLDIGGEAEVKKNDMMGTDGEKAGNVSEKRESGGGWERKSRGYSGAWP